MVTSAEKYVISFFLREKICIYFFHLFYFCFWIITDCDKKSTVVAKRINALLNKTRSFFQKKNA